MLRIAYDFQHLVQEQGRPVQNWRIKRKAYPTGHSSHFFGSLCFSVSTDLKRSPNCAIRCTTRSEGNTSRSAFFFLRAVATSSHVTGAETVGCSFARSE